MRDVERIGVDCSVEDARAGEAGIEPESPREEDYYMEGPLLIFTAAYHLRRGSCCHSGCRHCPYGEELSPRPGA